MRGSATTLTFTALLCLEVLPKPSIWADPGTMVTHGSPVTIWCQGSLLADVYHLYKEGDSVYWEAKALQGSRNKAWFHFASSSSSDAGQYQCAYQSRNRSSEHSDPLYRAPSLSAQPSPVVAAGGRVSLICSSQYAAGSLHLLKEGGADPLRHKTSRSYGNQGREQAVFPVGPVTTSHGGTYRCYDAPSIQPYLWSRPSDPLHLQVTGEAPRDRGRDTGILGQDVGGSLGREWGQLCLQPQEQGWCAALCLHALSAGLSRAPSLSRSQVRAQPWSSASSGSGQGPVPRGALG
uniref:Ig-like domain-containing protein n=1 Tax=Bos mutus grunniens TaxID=30521 RepID=A0A8B9Y301_BOSMU